MTDHRRRHSKFSSQRNSKDKYCAKIIQKRPIEQEELWKYVHDKYFPDKTFSTVCKAFKSVNEAIMYYLSQGRDVDLGFMKFSLEIKGEFNGPNDEFDEKRHQLVVNVEPGEDFVN